MHKIISIIEKHNKGVYAKMDIDHITCSGCGKPFINTIINNKIFADDDNTIDCPSCGMVNIEKVEDVTI
jgi:uncharacterized Zn finger protein